jgi:hypothetical protein
MSLPIGRMKCTNTSRQFHKVGICSRCFRLCESYSCTQTEPLPDPSKFIKREGEAERHAARRKNADVEAEYNAVTCVAVYMLLMTFSQTGIDKLRNHHEHMKMRHPDEDFVVSEGFDAGLSDFPIIRLRYLTVSFSFKLF